MSLPAHQASSPSSSRGAKRKADETEVDAPIPGLGGFRDDSLIEHVDAAVMRVIEMLVYRHALAVVCEYDARGCHHITSDDTFTLCCNRCRRKIVLVDAATRKQHWFIHPKTVRKQPVHCRIVCGAECLYRGAPKSPVLYASE